MYYCILLILSYVNLFFRNKLNVKQAIDYVAQSWSEVTSITIQNCWHKTDILPHTQELEIQELELQSVTNILRKRLYDYEKMQEKSKKQVTIDQYFHSNTNI